MRDLQSEKDLRNIPLKKVGIKNLKWPVTVMNKYDEVQHTVAEMELSVDLPHDVRGVHMSRFVEAVKEMKGLSLGDIETMLENLRQRLDAKVAHCRIDFDYFIKRKAPVTEIPSLYDVRCSFDCEKGEDFKFVMGIVVPVSTLCPCSREISDYGAHNQRATIHINVEMDRDIWIEDIVRIAEESASTPIFSLLKRPDEKWITERAYMNPKFVEDAARDVAIRLENYQGVKWYSVHVESQESIHNHNAFAYTEKKVEI